jgi:hypothetical protein
MAAVIDATNLAYLWGKIKAYVDAHSGGGGATVVPVVTSGTELATVNGTSIYAPAHANRITSQTVQTSGQYVPTAASAYTSAAATGWTVQEYADGLVHCFGIVDATSIAISTNWNGFYRSADRHMRLPVRMSRLLSVNFGDSLGGSAVGRITAAMAGTANAWQGAAYSLNIRFFSWQSVSSGTSNHMYVPVDVWLVKG